MALRCSSRIKQSCCSATGKAKQQEQRRPRSSSKAVKNTMPTEDTQAEEFTERDAKRAKVSKQPAAATKRKSKVMTVKERKSLLEYLDSGDDTVLVEVVKDDLKQQLLADNFQNFTEALCTNEQLLTQLVICHRKCFSQLYIDCKKKPDPMLSFQLCWHKQCSSFLLSEEHSISLLKLELTECDISDARDAWLHYCAANDMPVPKSNPVMITISGTIYKVLLERVSSFQQSLTTTVATAMDGCYKDGDDVYYRFGGAAICEMLKLHYQQIRSCSDEQRDNLSQEILILQAINTKDKSNVPDYLKYRDRGYMYFPHSSFIPFLREVDSIVKGVVNSKTFEENGRDLVQMAHKALEVHSDIWDMFKSTLAQRLPNFSTFPERAVNGVFNVLIRKLCNIRVQEFVSAKKQQLAAKKGLASTTDVNLRTTLLVHHTKLETKLHN